jgi:hypothetical protein
MSLHAHTTNDDREEADRSKVAAEAIALDALATTIPAPGAEDPDSTIHIELNFNAFADDVPPTQHAKRAPSYTDPSVQDFADQALELAALRAELNRLTRDYDALLYTLQLRDARLQRLQDQLALARSTAQDARRESAPADLTSTLDISPPRAEPPVAAPSAPRTAQNPKAAERQLIPVGHEGAAVVLSRDILTIGRTKENDICIASRAVSRDHARLLLSPRSVTIVDMDSANGCFVNEAPVKKQTLRDGDVLRIGDRSYRFVAKVSVQSGPASAAQNAS